MSVATGTFAAAAITAGITAGGVAAGSIYSAHKQSDAAETAAKTQSDAATKSAQIQADSANHAADLQAQAAQQALQFERAQSQLSLDQYNQQQQRLQPYRNLGNFALGLPNEAGPAPLQLAALPGQQIAPTSGTMPTSPQTAATTTGDPKDPNFINQQLTKLYAQYGLKPTGPGSGPTDIAYMAQQIANTGGWQGGNASYWQQRIPQELSKSGLITGSNGTSTEPATVAAPNQKVTLNYKPSITTSAGIGATTPALQAPTIQNPAQLPAPGTFQYRPLSQIGGY